jgi:tRNA (guanosine-2'-O-)-methyltransferase
MSIHDLPINPNQKVSLVFGNEHEGISEEVKSKVDGLVHIPMRGFTESFNISVSASIFLYELMKRANQMEIPNFNLSDQDRAELRLRWYKDIVPHADIHERHFRQQTQNL